MNKIYINSKNKKQLKKDLNNEDSKGSLEFTKKYTKLNNLIGKIFIFFPLELVNLVNTYVNDIFDINYSVFSRETEDNDALFGIKLVSNNMILNYEKIIFDFEICIVENYTNDYTYFIQRSINENYKLITQNKKSTKKYNKLLSDNSYNFINEHITQYDEDADPNEEYKYCIDDYVLFFNNFMEKKYNKKNKYILEFLFPKKIRIDTFSNDSIENINLKITETCIILEDRFDSDPGYTNIDITRLITNPKMLKNVIVIMKIICNIVTKKILK